MMLACPLVQVAHAASVLIVAFGGRPRVPQVTVADEEELSIPDDKHALLRGGGDDWR